MVVKGLVNHRQLPFACGIGLIGIGGGNQVFGNNRLELSSTQAARVVDEEPAVYAEVRVEGQPEEAILTAGFNLRCNWEIPLLIAHC